MGSCIKIYGFPQLKLTGSRNKYSGFRKKVEKNLRSMLSPNFHGLDIYPGVLLINGKNYLIIIFFDMNRFPIVRRTR